MQSRQEATRQMSARNIVREAQAEGFGFFHAIEVQNKVFQCCQAATMDDLTMPRGDIIKIERL